MSKARIPDYLAHILKAIGRIQRYTADMSEAMFLSSEMAQDAVLRNIEIIGYGLFAGQGRGLPALRSTAVRERWGQILYGDSGQAAQEGIQSL